MHVKEFAESKRFEKVREGFESENSCRIFQGIRKCLALFWPYLKRDIEERLEKDEQNPDSNVKSTFCIQVHPVDGALQMRAENAALSYQKDPIDNPFPDLQLFSKAEVETLSKLYGEKVYKARINGTYYL